MIKENSKIAKTFKFRPMKLGRESIGGSVKWFNGGLGFPYSLHFLLTNCTLFQCLICSQLPIFSPFIVSNFVLIKVQVNCFASSYYYFKLNCYLLYYSLL